MTGGIEEPVDCFWNVQFVTRGGDFACLIHNVHHRNSFNTPALIFTFDSGSLGK
jgi:hypothetical protein